jgi:hypothetical protein
MMDKKGRSVEDCTQSSTSGTPRGGRTLMSALTARKTVPTIIHDCAEIAPLSCRIVEEASALAQAETQ